MYTDYKTAFNAAVERANKSTLDVGISTTSEFGRIGFEVFFLPRPENRTGRELRCEVVKPGTPARL